MIARPHEGMQRAPVSDPRWRDLSAPLLRFLKARGGATKSDIAAWAHGAGVSPPLLVQLLAWLEQAKLIRAVGLGRRGIVGKWHAVEARETGFPPEEPPAPSVTGRRARRRGPAKVRP